MAFSFGSSSAQTTPSFSFGSTPQNKPTTSFSFGSPSVNPQTPTLFQGQGTGTTAATTTPSFNFGGSTTTPSTSFGGAPATPSLFGNNSSILGTPIAPPPSHGYQNQPIPTQSIALIMAQYDPQNSHCKFRHILYNRVDKEQIAQYTRPPNIEPSLWHQAVSANPDPSRLVPAQAVGFQDLKSRIDEQDKITHQQTEQIETIKKFLQTVQNNHDLDTRLRIEEYRRRHLEQCHRMIRIVKKLEILKSKGHSVNQVEEQMRSKLESCKRELNRPTHFKGRLNELQAQVRMQEDRQSYTKYPSLTTDDQEQIFEFLSNQTEGIAQLTNVLKKIKQDLEIFKEEMEGMRK